MIAIEDAHLPGLSDLGPEALHRITGRTKVELLRLRYRAGKRAILHLGSEEGEGVVWFFQGDKASRLARRHKTTARYDETTGAFFEPFPHDHRMPQIRAFLEDYDATIPDLIGARPSGAPKLLRYRPGLSCTFRCIGGDGRTAYVKLINNDDPLRLAEMNRHMVTCLTGSPVSVAPVIGTAPRYSAIAYAAAAGDALDAVLARSSDQGVIRQAIDALRRFWKLDVIPDRVQTEKDLLERAAESAAFACLTVPEAMGPVMRALGRLKRTMSPLALCPIHADMKLEHLFIDGDRTTLIDTESVSLGPPDYDLAQLYGRLWQAELEGQLSENVVAPAAREVRSAAGDGFDWCLGIVALRLAKYYTQRPSEGTATKISGILERLS